LREVAYWIAAAAPDGVYVARLGGDEFLAVMSGANEVAARAAAEGFVTAIEELGATLTSFPLSASVGIATGAAAESAEQLLHRADQAMYRAKAIGRGRCEFAALPEVAGAPGAGGSSRGGSGGPIPLR
jgi:diguanylate cyclase (GGDEF)-like protein